VSFTFSYKELIATGLAGSLLAFLASKWHVSGVLLGALSPMVSTVIMAIVKAFPGGGLPGGPRLPAILYILGSFWWFASRSAGMRQSILLEGLRAGLTASVISAGTVVGTQTIAGKDLTCLIWEECHRGIFPPQNNGPPPSNESARAVGAVANSGRVGGGGFALVGASVLLGSGILSLAIMRRRG
jgi:hypothetical protein